MDLEHWKPKSFSYKNLEESINAIFGLKNLINKNIFHFEVVQAANKENKDW